MIILQSLAQGFFLAVLVFLGIALLSKVLDVVSRFGRDLNQGGAIVFIVLWTTFAILVLLKLNGVI